MYTLGFFSEIGEAIMDGLRTFMLTLCDGIYRLIYFTFYVFEKLGTATIIQEDQVQDIFTRVGLIIGIFMVFRLTFAFIQYIIDPDSMTDNKKGAGNIIKKIVIAIVLLGSTSTIFKLAFRAQDLIVKSDILSKIIFNNDIEETDSFGGRLSAEVFTAFYRLNDEANTSGKECEAYFVNNENTNIIKTNIAQKNGSLDIAYTCLTERDSNGNYLVSFDGGGFIPLVVGVIVLYTVIIFTIQVGVRLVQLAYLQIIAPIPIIMYVTPKGDDYLKKWGTQCLTTFLDFFLRTAIIYFAIAIIQNIIKAETIEEILTGGVNSTSGWQTAYIFVIMIIAVLVFAKKVPALLKEIFPSLGGAAGFDYGLSFKKQVVEPLKTAYNSPLGWGLKLGKSVGSGIDRKVHGKPFFGRGKLGQAIDKWLPEQAEVRKQKEEAQAAARHREDMLKQGEELFNKYNGDSDALTGSFSSGEYKKSYLALRKAKKDTGEAELELSAAQADLNAAHASGNREAIRIAKDRLQVATDNLHAMQGNLELAKTRHDSNKKIFKKDAEKEDAFKYWKDTHSEIKNYSENMPDLSGQSQQDQINRTLQEILQNQQGTDNESIPNTNNSNIIVEEHVQSRPRQETTSTSVQDEYSRLVSQYNGETDPSKKAELRRQIEEFERRH